MAVCPLEEKILRREQPAESERLWERCVHVCKQCNFIAAWIPCYIFFPQVQLAAAYVAFLLDKNKL